MKCASSAEEYSLSRIFGTFGIYRYCLSILVMTGHIAYVNIAFAGSYAVFAFFVLSGYVVSYILHYNYLGQKGGLKKYALNRALRIYPPFWVASLLLLWLIASYHPERMPGISSIMGYPESLPGYLILLWLLINLSALASLPMLGYMLTPTIMPVGWSLGVEIFYWTLLPLFLLRPRLLTCATIFAVGYTLAVNALSFKAGHPLYVLSYYSPLAGCLPFLIGLYCFECKRRGLWVVPHALGIAAMVLFVLLVCFFAALESTPSWGIFYLSLALNTIIVLYLGRFDQRRIPDLLAKIDSHLGDLAYPIFVLHMPAAMLLHVISPELLHTHRHQFFLLAFLTTNVAAILLHYTLEAPINRIRKKIKA